MKNWFVFKDISTEYYPEIVVNELPPIIVPQKRHTITYNEGVDGGVIEGDGYDFIYKSVTISIKSFERLDEIVSWLTGKGKIIFGNETTKYYVGEILDQIVYERLGRFKTALITFTCQPYKYLLDEQPQTFTTAGTYKVYNNGTVTSMPLITIYATDTVEFTVNGYEYAANLNEYYPNCQIDSEAMNTYTNLYGEWQIKNVLFEEGINYGAPPYPLLNPGENTIAITGTFTSFEVAARSRFI